jgi:type I restriction enzyme, S subunit
MSSEIVEHSLNSLCLLVVDCPHATPKWTDSGVVVLRNQNIKGGRLDLSTPSFTDEENYHSRVKRATPKAGDIVITREAPMGDVCQIPHGLRCCLGQRQVLLRPDPAKIDARFLLFALQSPYIQHQIGWNEGTGSTVSNLRIPVLEALKIPTPSMSRQVEIASLLGAVDDRIALLRETNATLEAIAQALFKSWFVDFDPVYAKQQGIAPAGMDDATAALFPDGFESSIIGDIPAGWNVKTLEDLLVLQRGFDLPAQDRIPGAYPIIAASGPSGTHREAMVKGPGVVTGRSGVLGRVFLEFGDYWPLNTALWIKEFRAATPCYAYELLRLLDFKAFNAGSAVPTLNRNHIHGLPYVIPARACVEAFENIAEKLHQRVKKNEAQAQTLATLRDTLLPRLISGQLRLPEAEEQLAEAIA